MPEHNEVKIRPKFGRPNSVLVWRRVKGLYKSAKRTVQGIVPRPNSLILLTDAEMCQLCA
jgi:hypothetical protein